MNIYITNEHFSDAWFCFKEGEEKDNLLTLSDKICGSIHIFSDEGTNDLEFVSIPSNELNLLSYEYSWCDKPIIRFSTKGIDCSDNIIKKGTSYFTGQTDYNFLNAQIELEELTEDVIRCAGISIEDLILYAKFRWCEDMDLNCIFEDEALYIENKISLGKEKVQKLADDQFCWAHYEDDEY